MEAFAVSLGLVALAELGDKTQLLALVLASRFRRPAPILLGIFAATLANHLLASAVGLWVGAELHGPWLKWLIALSFFAIAAWALVPDRLDDTGTPMRPRLGVFLTTAGSFFLVEMGDRTQIATAVLAARFGTLLPVVAGTTAGMLAANVPVVLFGDRLSRWMSMRVLRWGAILLSLALGVATLLE